MRESRGPIGKSFAKGLVWNSREDFLEYFNTNADSSDRSQDDAISTWDRLMLSVVRLIISLSCLVVSLEGRMYPVETAYLEEPVANYVEAAVQTVFDIHMKVRSPHASPIVDGILISLRLCYRNQRGIS